MSRSAPATLLAVRIMLVAAVGGYAVRTLVHVPPWAANFLDNWFYDGVLLSPRLVCASRAAFPAQSRAGWLALGTGIASWTAGDIYWTHWIGNDPNLPIPSFADLGYLGLLPARVRRLHPPRSASGFRS